MTEGTDDLYLLSAQYFYRPAVIHLHKFGTPLTVWDVQICSQFQSELESSIRCLIYTYISIYDEHHALYIR